MEEEEAEPIQIELLVAHDSLAKLRIKNWLMFIAWLQERQRGQVPVPFRS
jgi:hypothetical protein